jgi:insecticidal toxin complex protein TccC
MPEPRIALHAHTPTLRVVDPRGLTVRTVTFYRAPNDAIESDAQARVHRVAYDSRGREERQWDPRLWSRFESGEGEDVNQRTVTSLSGTVLRRDSVDAGWLVNLWNDASQPVHMWAGRGSTRHIDYDSALRPIAISEALVDEPARVVERFTYGDADANTAAHNQCGRLIRHDDPAGTRHLRDYDLNGAVLHDTRHFLAALDSPDWPEDVAEREALLEPERWATAWRHNALGEIDEQTDARGNTQRFTYSVSGQLREAWLRLADGTEQCLVGDLAYTASGQPSTQTAGNGVTTRWTYDAADGRLQRLCSQRSGEREFVQDLSYSYDPVGNVTAIADAIRSTQYFAGQRIDPISRFRYDSLYQLTEAHGRETVSATIGPGLPAWHPLPGEAQVNYRQTYDYDAGGNLTALHHQGAQTYTRRMAVAPASNRGLPWPDAGEPDFAAGFDGNGNLRSLQPGQALQWDARNQLVRATLVAREHGSDDAEHYVYDGNRQRVRKVRSTQARVRMHTREVRYLPGLEWRTDTATSEVLQVISVPAGATPVRCLHWESEPPADLPNHQLRYTCVDHLGSIALEWDEDATLISHEWYYPYGGTAGWAGRSEREASYKSIRYSGKERDATGLYYYGFRYYVPWLQRWLNPDPAGDVDGLNLFGFLAGRPMARVDQDGLMWRPGATAAQANPQPVNLTMDVVDHWARSQGVTVAARGLPNFNPAERGMVVEALSRAADTLGHARYMAHEQRDLSLPIMSTFFGNAHEHERPMIVDTYRRTHEIALRYRDNPRLRQRFVRFSGDDDTLAAVHPVDTHGHISIHDSFFTVDQNLQTQTIIHEMTHLSRVVGLPTLGGATSDYWYIHESNPELISDMVVNQGILTDILGAAGDADRNFVAGVENFYGFNQTNTRLDTTMSTQMFFDDPRLRSHLAARNADNIAFSALYLSDEFRRRMP